jgi:hypothetical protein
MPWMPEVFAAPIAEARRAEDATRTNDAIAYYEGILAGEPDALATTNGPSGASAPTSRLNSTPATPRPDHSWRG